MDINKFAHEVHKNAVDHGWWEGDHPREEILAMINSEWSEALNEYRNDMPMEYKICLSSGEPCEKEGCSCWRTKKHGGWCSEWDMDSKPEGIAVELIDGCLCILDYIASDENVHIVISLEEIERMSVEILQESGYKLSVDFPVFVGLLHTSTTLAFIEHEPSMLLQCIGNVFQYLREQGLDPERIMLTKHEFNKTRPYLHGGKKC